MKKLLAATFVALLMADSMVIAEGQKIETVGVFSDTVNGQGVIFTDGSNQKRYFAIKEVVQKLGDLKGKPVRISANVKLNPKDNALVMVYLSSVMPHIAENADGKIDLDDPETRNKIMAGAIVGNKLQKRGSEGEELFYPPNLKTPFTGWVKWMHGNGQIARLSQFKDGKREGFWTSWHNNGRKQSEGVYKDGKEDGLWTDSINFSESQENGQKKSEVRELGAVRHAGRNTQVATRFRIPWTPLFWVLIATLLLVGAVYLILRVKKSRQKAFTPEEAESRVLEDEESAPFSETQDQIKRNALKTAIRKTLHQPGKIDLTPEEDEPSAPFPETRDQIKRDALETAIRKTLYQPHKDNADKDVTSLEVLSAGGEGISDLSGLRDARNLTYLDLSGNRITDITVLSGLTKLTELNLRTNQVTDITPLANLIDLEELWLYENKITDLTPLVWLKNLSKLYLGLNDITDEQKAMLKKSLPNCEITF